jgi:hypothetical protein
LQPLADRVPQLLTSTNAARRIADMLKDQGIQGPKRDTIRKLIDAGKITYRAGKR